MARDRSFQSAPMLGLILALLTLLALFASLQYRWLTRISESEQERMRSALRANATRFCEDFDRELARAFVAFRVDYETARGKNSAAYAERYTRWLKQAPHAEIVGKLWLLTAAGQEALQLSQFDSAAGRFVPLEWPERLQALRQRVEDQRKDLVFHAGVVAASEALPRPPKQGLIFSKSFTAPVLPPSLISEPPALLIPALPFSEPMLTRLLPDLPTPDFLACAIVELNLDYLRQHFIPALAARHFAAQPANGELEYQLAIVKRAAPQSVIYATPDFAPASGFDATENLFSLRLDLVDDFSFAVALSATGPRVNALPLASAMTLAAPLPNAAPAGATHLRRGEGSGGAPPPPIAVQGAAGGAFYAPFGLAPWELRLKHRAGSLEEVVAQLRRRNLAVSFGILLLLAASVVLIYLSAQRARRLARQQIEFVAGVSHELRVPVSVVCLTSANLADGLVRDQQQVKQYGQLLRDAGRRLAEAIEQVLDFAGVEMLRQPYQLAPVAAESLIERVLAANAAHLQAAGFAVKTEIAAALPFIKADSLALERALQNLLSNALKYSNGSRAIELRAQPGKSDTEVQITVADRGLGIEPQELPTLFEPFKRGAAAVAAQIPGNGLGLYLVKRIVEAHGGSVSVRSQPGQGSAFTLHLPALEKSREVWESLEKS